MSDTHEPNAAPATFQSFDRGVDAAPPADLSVISDVSLEVVVVLGRTRMSISEMLQLRAGAIVELGPAGGTVEVLANGSLVAKGEVVVSGDELGVRITEVIKGR